VSALRDAALSVPCLGCGADDAPIVGVYVPDHAPNKAAVYRLCLECAPHAEQLWPRVEAYVARLCSRGVA
jgi:hypothetical protein